MTDSATPETGVEPVKVTDERSAVARVNQLMGRMPVETRQATQEEPEATPKPNSVKESQPLPEESGAEAVEEAAEGDEPGSEPAPEDVEAEFPDSLDRIAEALEVQPHELLDRLKAKVKVDGEEREVTLAEAIKGYSREADYLRKTESLADAKKEFEARSTQATEAVNVKLQELHGLATLLGQQLQAGPTDAELLDMMDVDPVQAQKLRMQRDMQRQHFAQAWGAIQQEKQRVENEQRMSLFQKREREQALLAEALPVFRDPQKIPAYEQQLKATLSHYGYSKDEIDGYFTGLFDHRHIKIVDDAMKWRALKHEKVEMKTKLAKLPVPKTLKPSAKAEEPKNDVSALRDRLRKPSSKSKESISVALVKGLMARS